MSYSVSLRRSALKELQSLPKTAVQKVGGAIDKLAENPRPDGVKKLKSSEEDLYRIRVGDFRIVYSIEDEIKIVDIRKIGHRKDIYR